MSNRRAQTARSYRPTWAIARFTRRCSVCACAERSMNIQEVAGLSAHFRCDVDKSVHTLQRAPNGVCLLRITTRARHLHARIINKKLPDDFQSSEVTERGKQTFSRASHASESFHRRAMALSASITQTRAAANSNASPSCLRWCCQATCQMW